MGLSNFSKSAPIFEALKGFSMSFLSWLYFFGGNSLCWKVLVWCLFLRSGLEIFLLRASANLSHSFQFLILGQISKFVLPSEVSNVLIFLFRIFCILILFSYAIHVVVLMQSWGVAHDFFALCDKLFVWCCFDHLFRFNCSIKMIIFLNVPLVPHDDLDQTLSRDDFHLTLYCVILNSLLGLIEILRFSFQICLRSPFSVCKTY